VLGDKLKRPKRVACEFEAFAPQLFLGWNAPLVEIDAIVFELRRRKDPDELRLLARANEANRAMYQRAREVVRPGVNELDIYTELHSVAVRTLGEPLTYFGQDFRSNARGGPPRDRQVAAGDLMIIDLGVGFRGYHSDNCRTIAVDGAPTDAQQRAWRAVADVFPLFQSIARAGASCREIFDSVQRQLDQFQPWVFNHHLGHGVGLAPQEGPHLNPRWDDTLAEGEFLAVEPGLYHEELRTGVRLEQNFLVKADGVELLTDWKLELV
jgi:Xaa-Pro aminopeptidase